MRECYEFAADFLHFVQQCPTIMENLWLNDEANFHFVGFVNKQNTCSEFPKIHTVVETSFIPSCSVKSASKGLLDRSIWRAP